MNNQISSLVEDQLPGFITAEYENFGKILEAYYEHLESPGNTLDILSNLTQYHDIDFYEKGILKEKTILRNYINASDTTIIVEDASSFPEKNGYIRIENEICFYKRRTDTEFLEVSRGVSGTTNLGDLYSESKFISTVSSAHISGVAVDNLSNLFLYAIVKSFEKQYLESFPESYLGENIDKRTLIKNISTFYKVKGTDKSIRFIFNTIVSKSIDDIPTTYNPKDYTLKVSESDWNSSYGIEALILSGNPDWMLGQTIVQSSDSKVDTNYASASVENFYTSGSINGLPIVTIILNSSSLNSEFTIPQQTVLTRSVPLNLGTGDTISVDSTFGWKGSSGVIVINGEVIEFEGKTSRQFYIKNRGTLVGNHAAGDVVYSYSTAKVVTPQGTVSLLIYGILTNLEVSNPAPYALVGDRIQLSKPGFETLDPFIYDGRSNNIRWKINTNGESPAVPDNFSINQDLQKYLADIHAIYQDKEYYYVASSSYPQTPILKSSTSGDFEDPQLLKIIPKKPITAQEIYQTSNRDVGIFVDGSIAFSAKDEDNLKYGPITSIEVISRGSGYNNVPYVLINGVPGIARATLSGDTVNEIVTASEIHYDTAPTVEIVSGRNAVLQAIVTSGEISSIRIVNPGEYYSSPPSIVITDIAGKGRFAEYKAVISNQGQIVELVKISGGKFYTQENVIISVVPDANSNQATAVAKIRQWTRNRYLYNSNDLDLNGGLPVVSNDGNAKKYYGIVSNPRRLRRRLGDNISSTLQEENSSYTHSPILGYAYDGNPIYGPYGYSNPLDKNSTVVRMNTGYNIKSSRVGGPPTSVYPLGSFVDDYEWIATVQTGKTRLDRNNGRFCVTPEYPKGVYAYFITINTIGNPEYPYILGENFYNVPVQSNYNSYVTQSELPRTVKRLFVPGTRKNGANEVAYIESVSSGYISNVIVEDSQPIFTTGCKVYVDNEGTDGEGASAYVSSTFGKPVISIESRETKAILLNTVENFYSFVGDIITQPFSGATGELVRDCVEENKIVLRNVSGNFIAGRTINSNSTVLNLLLSQNSTFTKDAIISLVEFDDPSQVIASGICLSGTTEQNSVRIKVVSGDFGDYLTYPEGETILKSSDLGNTAGSEIVIIKNLSQGITVSEVDGNIAIAETDGNHDFAEGDVVSIDIDPDQNSTETTYYVSKKKYLELDLIPLNFNSKLNDTGIGSSTVVGLGRDYVSGTYQNVELIFSNYSNTREGIGSPGDENNAKATVIVNSANFDDSGQITSIVITDPGSEYNTDDILTVNPDDLPKITSADSSVDVEAEMELQNEAEVSGFTSNYFSVAPGDYQDVLNGLGIPGTDFVDGAGKSYTFISQVPENNAFEYFPLGPYTLAANDTVEGKNVVSAYTQAPPGAPLPQYRFKENGVENPTYNIRVGSTFSFEAIPNFSIYIVSKYSTFVGTDGRALVIDEYTPVPGVTNNGVVISAGQTEQITFVPTYPGTFYYLSTQHPEAVGIINVYPAPSTAIPLVSVDSIGLGVQRTDVKLDRVYSLSTGDLLQVDDEIIRVTSINSTTNTIQIERGVNNTRIVAHPEKSRIVSYNPVYRFIPGTKVFGNDVNDPRVVSYDPITHRLVVNFDFDSTSPREISVVSSFFDHSNPQKIVSISKVSDFIERLQFSLNNIEYEVNPIIELQKYYYYKFDTSHPSMLNAYFDVSASKNYNLFTEEKETSTIEPGHPGAFVRLRFGYGPAIVGTDMRDSVEFSNYFYFLTDGIVDTNGSYLTLKDDPLSGLRNVVYTTTNKFVYSLDDIPQYDGSGDMRYTGKSIGKIATITLDNFGSNYKSLPIISGVVPADGYKAIIEPVRDLSSGKIVKLDIIDRGRGYSKPKAVVSNGDGSGLKIDLITINGEISNAIIVNSGEGYTYPPLIDIIETDNKLFFESETIGVPQNAKFVSYGQGYYSDSSITPHFSSPFVMVLTNFDLDAFADGEKIEQKINGVITARGKVAKGGWRVGSNIIRLNNVEGVFREGEPILGKAKFKTATVSKIISTSFKPILKSLSRTLGRFESNKGQVGSTNQRITDSSFYQDYSYVIKSRTPINSWRNLINDTVHPAGFKMFGEVYVESEGFASMSSQQIGSQQLTSFIILPESAVSSFSTSRTITTSIVKVEDSNLVRGHGTASVDSFDETLTRVREIILTPAFDGRFDPNTGQRIGRKTFTMLDKKSNLPYNVFNEQELMITIDGVAQNPGYSYTVSGNQIYFYEAPFGKRQENVDGEDVDVPAQKVYIRAFKFREASDNTRYLKKLKDISNLFDGRTRIFDLYYEDDSIVKTDLNENLLIYLDGILQQGSYEIRRFNSPSKPDKIAFSKAPKDYKDFYDGELPEELENKQYFFGHSVGSYERMHIDYDLIPYNLSNSYVIKNSLNKVRNFDNPLYAYVFVNGVLQQHDIAYKIAGASIIFNTPLTFAPQSDGSFVTDRVDILYLYGKDYNSTLTMFDFEEESYYNRATIQLTGSDVGQIISNWYPLDSTKIIVHQVDNGVKKIWGEVIGLGPTSTNTCTIYLKSQNIHSVQNSDIYFSRMSRIGIQDSITVQVDSFDISYLTSVEGERILNRIESNYVGYLNTDDLSDSYEYSGFFLKEHPSLRVGDLIKIDGELDYRQVYSVPLFAKTKEYRAGEQVSNSYFAKISVSDYDRDTFGEGLSVVSKIANGSVTSLNWNKRDLIQYFENKVLLNPTTYQYYTPPVLNFVPVDGNGGGARAEVVVYGGQILDIVLTSGGSGYTKPPRVIVSRGYNVLRSNNYAESSFRIDFQSSEFILPQPKIVSIISDIPLWKWNLLEYTTAVLAPNPVDFENSIIRIIFPEPGNVSIPGTTYSYKQSRIEVPPIELDVDLSVDNITSTYYLDETFSGYTTYEHPVTKYYSTGVIDMLELPLENEFLYSQGKLGTTVGSFIDYIFMDVGYANVSGITLEQLEYTYTQFKGISDGIDTWMENYEINNSSITTDGTLFNPGIPSIQELMTYLDADLLIAGTVAYIPDTSNFPSSGKLLIGKELISYTSKLPDRLVGLNRGVSGTTAEFHAAGTLIRTVGLLTTT